MYVVEEISGTEKFYLTKIETVPTDSTGLRDDTSSQNSSVGTVKSIAGLFEFVKQNNAKYESDSDKPVSFTPKPVDPILLNEDGTPKVFYHGTSAEYGLAGIRELVENAILLDTEVHEHHNNNANEDRIAFDHKLYAFGYDNNKTAIYRITVEDTFADPKHPNDRRLHNLKYIEKVADNIGSLTRNKNGAESTSNVSTTVYSISDLPDLVNRDFADGLPKSVLRHYIYT